MIQTCPMEPAVPYQVNLLSFRGDQLSKQDACLTTLTQEEGHYLNHEALSPSLLQENLQESMDVTESPSFLNSVVS